MAIEQETYQFLSELASNNNREWFNDHKHRYQSALTNFTESISALIDQLSKFDNSVIGLEPKKAIFRIYRDTRFSKDKTPYKTHFGARLMSKRGGLTLGGYYLHIAPNETFLAGGIYHPEPGQLQQIRQEISYNLEDFERIVTNKEFIETFGALQGDQLKRPPKGYNTEDPAIKWLKHKDFIVRKDVGDDFVQSAGFEQEAASIFEKIYPMNNFFYQALND